VGNVYQHKENTSLLTPKDLLPQIAKARLFSKKLLLCVWWICVGFIRYEFLKMKETITAEIYCAQLERIQEKLLGKQPALVNRKNVFFFKTTLDHTLQKTVDKITHLVWDIMCHHIPQISRQHIFISL